MNVRQNTTLLGYCRKKSVGAKIRKTNFQPNSRKAGNEILIFVTWKIVFENALPRWSSSRFALRAAAPHRAQYKMEHGAQLARRPQPSGGLARADLRDARLQPSARGRLRAAGRCATATGKHFHHKQQLRAAAPMRAQIQNSRFKIPNYKIGPRLAKRLHERTRVAGLRRPRLRPAAVPFGTANSKFRIQYSKLAAASNLEAAPQPSGGPAFEQCEIAALRPGAAAGCCALSGANSK